MQRSTVLFPQPEGPINAVIWFCDLRESTPLADSMPRGDFLALLNQFFECMAGRKALAGGVAGAQSDEADRQGCEQRTCGRDHDGAAPVETSERNEQMRQRRAQRQRADQRADH